MIWVSCTNPSVPYLELFQTVEVILGNISSINLSDVFFNFKNTAFGTG
jgi:hypothetical protein